MTFLELGVHKCGKRHYHNTWLHVVFEGFVDILGTLFGRPMEVSR